MKNLTPLACFPKRFYFNILDWFISIDVYLHTSSERRFTVGDQEIDSFSPIFPLQKIYINTTYRNATNFLSLQIYPAESG